MLKTGKTKAKARYNSRHRYLVSTFLNFSSIYDVLRDMA